MRRLSAFAIAFLLLLAVLPAAAQQPIALVEGRDYTLIEGGQPLLTRDGRIEVAEVFSYGCIHCAHFAPKLEQWQARQRKDVRLLYVPLPAGPDDAFARGLYATADANVLGRAHLPVFRALHETATLPRNPTTAEMAAFYATLGLDGKRLKTAMDAPAMRERMAAAYQFARRSGVIGTPTIIVAGRYRVQGRDFDDTLRIVDALVARLRRP